MSAQYECPLSVRLDGKHAWLPREGEVEQCHWCGAVRESRAR